MSTQLALTVYSDPKLYNYGRERGKARGNTSADLHGLTRFLQSSPSISSCVDSVSPLPGCNSAASPTAGRRQIQFRSRGSRPSTLAMLRLTLGGQRGRRTRLKMQQTKHRGVTSNKMLFSFIPPHHSTISKSLPCTFAALFNIPELDPPRCWV